MLWKWRESGSAGLTEALAAIPSPESRRKPRHPTCKTRSDTTNRTRAAEPAGDRADRSLHATVLSPQPSVPPVYPSNRRQPGEGTAAGLVTLLWLSERARARGNCQGGAKDILGHLPACIKGELLKETSGSMCSTPIGIGWPSGTCSRVPRDKTFSGTLLTWLWVWFCFVFFFYLSKILQPL